MQNKAKTAKESLIVMTELVLPNDTNVFGNLMGGRLMYWMDIAAALSAGKHCNALVVTASVDNISFENPIKLGNVVHIEAKVSRAFNTSIEVHMKVWGEDHTSNTNTKATRPIIPSSLSTPIVAPAPSPSSSPKPKRKKDSTTAPSAAVSCG